VRGSDEWRAKQAANGAAGAASRWEKPEPELFPFCACGKCGQRVNNADAKFRPGHQTRVRRRGTISPADLARALAKPLTVRVPCGREWHGPAGEVLAASREHGESCTRCRPGVAVAS
jgi:hypothetical protein